jgi:hypothetical protein
LSYNVIYCHVILYFATRGHAVIHEAYVRTLGKPGVCTYPGDGTYVRTMGKPGVCTYLGEAGRMYVPHRAYARIFGKPGICTYLGEAGHMSHVPVRVRHPCTPQGHVPLPSVTSRYRRSRPCRQVPAARCHAPCHVPLPSVTSRYRRSRPCRQVSRAVSRPATVGHVPAARCHAPCHVPVSEPFFLHRAAASSHGLSHVPGSRARLCRMAADGCADADGQADIMAVRPTCMFRF